MSKETREKYAQIAVESGMIPVIFGWFRRLFTRAPKVEEKKDEASDGGE